MPSVFEVSSATGTVNGATPAPGQRDLELVARPARRGSAPSDSGITAPVAGSSIRRPSGASKCCIVVPAGNASSDVEYRRLPWRTNTLADGTRSAAAMPSMAVSWPSSVSFTGVANATCALTCSRRAAASSVASAESTTPPGATTQIIAAAAAMAVTGSGSGAECRRRCRCAGAGRCRARPHRPGARARSRWRAAAQLFAPTCSGRYDRGGEVGTTERRAQEADHDPADPGRDDRDRQRAPPPVEVVDARARPARRPGSATMSASAGITMLASRKPVSSSWITPFDGWSARGCTSCAPLLLASVRELGGRARRGRRRTRTSRAPGARWPSPPRSLDDRLGHEQHREAARRGHDLLLALRREQVLGREPDADDLERARGCPIPSASTVAPGARRGRRRCAARRRRPNSSWCGRSRVPAVIERSLMVGAVSRARR